MVIQMNEVKSSNIAKIGYDEENQVLRVQFNGGRMYDYLAVSVEEKDALLKAESIGRRERFSGSSRSATLRREVNKMVCPWLKSANQSDPLNTVCDLSKRRTLCGAMQAHCECPELLDAEMMLEYEREKEIDAHGIWLEMVDTERYIREGR